MNRNTIIASFAAGAIFGLGLVISGMANPAKVLGFLDLAGNWDPTLAFVMSGAILVAFPAFQLAKRREKPLLAERWSLPDRSDIDPRLLPGMTADVRISIAAEESRPQAIIVPVSAVDTTSRPNPSIWVYNESSGQVSRRSVQLGLPVDDEVVILDGLEGNELVVSGGWWRLSADQAVVVSDF